VPVRVNGDVTGRVTSGPPAPWPLRTRWRPPDDLLTAAGRSGYGVDSVSTASTPLVASVFASAAELRFFAYRFFGGDV
jgi:hypothetical protein